MESSRAKKPEAGARLQVTVVRFYEKVVMPYRNMQPLYIAKLTSIYLHVQIMNRVK